MAQTSQIDPDIQADFSGTPQVTADSNITIDQDIAADFAASPETVSGWPRAIQTAIGATKEAGTQIGDFFTLGAVSHPGPITAQESAAARQKLAAVPGEVAHALAHPIETYGKAVDATSAWMERAFPHSPTAEQAQQSGRSLLHAAEAVAPLGLGRAASAGEAVASRVPSELEAGARRVLPGDVPVPANAPIPPELSATSAPRGVPWEPPNTPVAKPEDPFSLPNEKGPSLDLPAAEQDRRGRVLSEIGLNDGYRQSAITGDPLAQSTDHQISLSDSPGGRVLKTAIKQEDDALHGYSEQTIESTGGRTGSDQTTSMRRADTVTDALQGISDSYDTKLKALYTEADKRAAGEATDLKGFQDVLHDDSMLTNSDRVSLRPAVNAYLKKLGVVDDNGNIMASVKQAETIRKYLNENWSPANSGFVKALKGSLDDDVTSAAGQDIYKSARALNTERANTIDNPKGIASIMDTSGPGGINRKVDSDEVMTKLETMDPPQLGHILDTLRKAANAGDAKSQAALSEIKAHFAQRAHDIGTSTATQWNVKGYNNFLKSNSESLGIVFRDDPETLHRLYTANEAGKILHRPTQYPGAANQVYNLNKSGTIPSLVQKGVTGAGAGIGAMIGGAPGAAVGGYAGEHLGASAAGRLSTSQALKRANARIVGPTGP